MSLSPSDEDEATEVSERGGGPSIGQGTDDSGASQEFSSFDNLSDNRGFDADDFEVAAQTYGGMGLGTGLSQQQFNIATGRTATNPFGNQGFFTSVFGIPPEMLDYTNIIGNTGGISQLNAMALDRYNNPIDAKGNVRGSVGDPTAFGTVIETDRPQSTTETIGRSLFGLSPLGSIASFVGTKQKSIAPIEGIQVPDGQVGAGFNYDPTLDPNNPAYQGPQSMLGQFGKTLEQITFGGARPVTESAKGIMSLYEAQDAKRAMGGYETFDGQKM
jgi:hypothetical protein